MAELYFEGSVTKAFEAGRKAGELAAAGDYLDVHCHDAALECVGQVNALTRHNHAPEPVPVPVGDVGDTPEAVGAKLGELCAQPPEGYSLSPTTIALLIQVASLALKLLDHWRDR